MRLKEEISGVFEDKIFVYASRVLEEVVRDITINDETLLDIAFESDQSVREAYKEGIKKMVRDMFSDFWHDTIDESITKFVGGNEAFLKAVDSNSDELLKIRAP